MHHWLDETVSEGVAERAHRFIEQRRVLVRAGFKHLGTEYAYVMGDNAVHVVRADNDGVYCECMAAQRGHVCAHVAAAMAVWAEGALEDPPDVSPHVDRFVERVNTDPVMQEFGIKARTEEDGSATISLQPFQLPS